MVLSLCQVRIGFRHIHINQRVVKIRYMFHIYNKAAVCPENCA